MQRDLLQAPDETLTDQEMREKVRLQEALEFAKMRENWRVRSARAVFAVGSFLAPWAILRALDGIFERPKRYKVPERETELLSRGRAFHVQSRHGKIAAWEWGEGPLVHLIHGWEGRGAQLGAVVDPLVEQGFRVVAWDAPAHGQSEGKTASAWTFGQVAVDVAKETGQPYAVYAHSMGAISTSVALSEGYAPERFVYIAPATAPEKPLRLIEEVMGVPAPMKKRFMDMLAERFGRDWESLRDGALPEGFSAPLLMIHDRGDREVFFDTSLRLQRNWPGSVVEFTNGLGHNRILRDEKVIARAAAFLAEGIQ